MSEKYTVTGELTHIGEIQEFDSGFKKRQIVVTTDEKYPQTIPLDLIKDKVSEVDQIPLGTHICVHFNLRGNEWKDRFYVNLQAWRVETGYKEGQQDTPAEPTPAAGSATDDSEDTPF